MEYLGGRSSGGFSLFSKARLLLQQRAAWDEGGSRNPLHPKPISVKSVCNPLHTRFSNRRTTQNPASGFQPFPNSGPDNKHLSGFNQRQQVHSRTSCQFRREFAAIPPQFKERESNTVLVPAGGGGKNVWEGPVTVSTDQSHPPRYENLTTRA